MKNIKYIYLLVFQLVTNTIFAQNQAPASSQTKAIALTGATIHTATGQVIENGVIVFNKGIITAIGSVGTAYDKANTETIDLSGYSKGMYVLKLIGDDKSLFKKIVLVD